MTTVDIIRLYDNFPVWKKIIGLRIVLFLEVNTYTGLYYNVRVIKAYKKWLWIKIKEYIPDGQ